MKKRILITAVAVLCFIAAVGIMLYPAVSNYINTKYQSEIHTAYVEQIGQVENQELLEAKEAAIRYNEWLVPVSDTDKLFTNESLEQASEGYEKQLLVGGSSIMAYVEIPSIDVYLPVYHGTDTSVLDMGVGHLMGTSLPIGGASTHAVLTAHSGMAKQRLFTDLPQVAEGDVFYIHVLTETLAYQVYHTEPVYPHETELLGITEGEDLCTLVTCVHIGVNTQRLLVQGKRIPYEAAQEVEEEIAVNEEPKASNWQDQYMLGIWLGLWAALLAAAVYLIVLLIRRKRTGTKRRKGGRYVRKRWPK